MLEQTTPSREEVGFPSYIVEPATPDDAADIFDVQRLTWRDTYPNADLGITEDDIRLRLEGESGELIPKKVNRWRETIEAGNVQRATFIIKDNDKVVGFVAPAILNGQRRIGAIYVLPGMQGKGIGQKLLDKAVDWHGRNQDIFLHVARYNQNAIDFYTRNGFTKTGRELRPEDIHVVNGKEIPEVEMVLKAA